MVTRRSILLILALPFLISLFLPGRPAAALTPEANPHTLAVGLLSSRDARPVARIAPFQSRDRLTVTLVPFQGPPANHFVQGEVFLAMEESDPGAAVARGREANRETTFSVQVSSLGDAEAARRFASRVRAHWPEQEVWVTEFLLGTGNTTHRVMAGRYTDRNSAMAFTTDLSAYGMDGAYVVQLEPPGDVDAAGLPLVIYSASTGLVSGLKRVFFAAATPQPSFRLDGAPYRGTLEVHGGPAGIVALNRIGMEQYLRGVVPCELGPDRFPQLEALKAQAVTARTYALKHAGRHRSEGFDLCDTPHCQVYGGAGREHPLSNEAVLQTAGLAGYYQGRLAETLYTSTCGGHTEISSAVFSGEAPAYLTGVPCTTGHRGPGISIPPPLVRSFPRVVEKETGADLGFALGLLSVLGIVEDGTVAAGEAGAAQWISSAEAEQWSGRLVSRFRPDGGSAAGGADSQATRAPTRCQLAHQLCRALGWRERLETLFTTDDLEEILGPGQGCDEQERRALAYLITSGIFLRYPDGGAAAERPMSRGRFAAALSRLAVHLEPGLFTEAALTGAAGGKLILRTGETVEPREIAPRGVQLFERRQEVTSAVPVSRLRSGDRVLVHLDRQSRVELLVRLPASGGAAADRYSPYAFWSIVVQRETIEALLEEKGHRVGKLVDLQPLDRGPGGRLSSLRVVGSSGNTVLRGLDVRWNLSTRENLFFIDRLAGPDGSILAYRFTGRGWGHGVGMCQVGAAGLAESGATFIDILEHYYPGIVVRPAAGSGP